MKQENKVGPEKRFSAGAVNANIWRNEVPNKTAGTSGYYTISLQRSYKDKAGKWQNSSSMRINDLPKAALVLSRSYEYLVLKENQEDTADSAY
ncbi:MAG: hypothetical protein V1837_07250 [Candidatus Woesearchaeota archaeon]